MSGVRDRITSGAADRLRLAVERTGYYPELVLDTLDLALAGEQIAASVVHHEAHFDGDELRRHVTLLVLTGSRLLIVHTDEYPPDEMHPVSFAMSSTEAVPLSKVASVVVTRTVEGPGDFRRGDGAAEIVLSVGWGAVSRVELEVATCGDPDCTADHGYTGSLTADDYTLRVSAAGDGPNAVQQVVAFARALSAATTSTAG
jgi:hypothetical protein